MNVNATRLLQKPLHLVQPRVQPDQVARHAAFPDVRERPQLVLVAEDDVVLPARKERRVDVDEVNALRGQLAHDVQVVAPEQPVRLQFRMAKRHALDHLGRQHDLGEQLAKALAPVPTERLLLDRHAAEARRRAPKLLLRGQRVSGFVFFLNFRRGKEVPLCRTDRRTCRQVHGLLSVECICHVALYSSLHAAESPVDSGARSLLEESYAINSCLVSLYAALPISHVIPASVNLKCRVGSSQAESRIGLSMTTSGIGPSL